MIIGSDNPKLVVLINHNLPEGTAKNQSNGKAVPLTEDWMDQIIAAGGNNWRKIFNIYAKLCFSLLENNRENSEIQDWQTYRSNCLLVSNTPYQLVCLSGEALKSFYERLDTDTLVLITGKKCASELAITERLHWIDQDFAQAIGRNGLLCPYFDYRQLSNIKLEKLTGLIQERISP